MLYNVQRLLGLTGSPIARALDATTAQGWTPAVYRAKVERVGAVLRDATGGTPPAVLVLIEVEDADCVADVLAAAGWAGLVSAVPPAEQVAGWDVAIAYDPSAFPGGATHVESHVFSNRFGTRDLLVAHLATTAGRSLVVMATHWPSRKVSNSGPQRQAAAAYCDTVLEGTLKYLKQDLLTAAGAPQLPPRDDLLSRWRTPVLVAGDLNDEPWDTSVRALGSASPDLDATTRPPAMPTANTLRSVATYLSRQPRLYNPTWTQNYRPPAPGTYHFGSAWHRIDQFLVSAGMLVGAGPRLVDGSLRVHHPRQVTVAGQPIAVTTPAGYPIAFSATTRQGVSDHLPLLADIEF